MNLSIKKLTDIMLDDAGAVLSKVAFAELHGKTIIVTGASGLLGSHFLACLWKLSEEKNDINTVAVMRSSSPAYINALLDYRNSKIFYGDIGKKDFLDALPEADYIIHAAGYGQPGRFMENPVNTIEINTTGTLGLIDKLRPGGKFLFLSTSELYMGLVATSPYRETQIGTTNTTHPRACYIDSKRCGEAICNAYRQRGIQAKSARLSLAYGPGVRTGDKRVINSFIEKALVEEGINMLDLGQAMRTYCYVSDAVYMLWRILMEGKQAIYNVGGISRISIAELAEAIGRITKVSVRIPDSDKSGIAGAPDDVCLDITKFEREFHPMPFLPIDEGLSRTVGWMRNFIEFANLSENNGSTREVYE